MKSGLRTCKEHFYFFLGVPTGLSSIIQKPEILKSLHTNDRKTTHLLKGFRGIFPGIPDCRWYTIICDPAGFPRNAALFRLMK